MVRQALLGLAAAVFGLVLVLRLTDGTSAFLVQSWYQPILVGSATVLLALAALATVQALRNRGTEQRFRLSRPGVVAAVLIGLPLALGIAFKPQPLGTASLDSGRASALGQFASSAGTADPTQRNIYQWAYEFQTTDPSKLVGQPVEVIGFVYHGKDDPADRFSVARFVVACCVADATGFKLPVQWAQGAALPLDKWVRVAGRVATAQDGSAIIQASAVEQVEAPSNPYIYP